MPNVITRMHASVDVHNGRLIVFLFWTVSLSGGLLWARFGMLKVHLADKRILCRKYANRVITLQIA